MTRRMEKKTVALVFRTVASCNRIYITLPGTDSPVREYEIQTALFTGGSEVAQSI